MKNDFNYNTQSIQWLLTNLNTLAEEISAKIGGEFEYVRTVASSEYMSFINSLPLGSRIHFKKLVIIPQTNTVLPMPTVRIFERGDELPSIDVMLTGVVQTMDDTGSLHYAQTYVEFNDFIFTKRKDASTGSPSEIIIENCQVYIEYRIL